MSAHTPGPWKAFEKSLTPSSYFIAREQTRGWICEVGPFPIDDAEQRAANARLIAAAPSLLAALEIVLASHDASCKGEECQISGIDLARAAISKATSLTEAPRSGLPSNSNRGEG